MARAPLRLRRSLARVTLADVADDLRTVLRAADRFLEDGARVRDDRLRYLALSSAHELITRARDISAAIAALLDGHAATAPPLGTEVRRP